MNPTHFPSRLISLPLAIACVLTAPVYAEEAAFARFRHLDGYYAELGQPFLLEIEPTGDGITIVSVEFHVDDALVATDAEAPFEAMWTPDRLGKRIVTATATNDSGATCAVSIETESIFRPATPLFDDMKHVSLDGDLVSLGDKLFLQAEDGYIYESIDGDSWRPAFNPAFPLTRRTLRAALGRAFVRTERGLYFTEDGEYWHHNPIALNASLGDIDAIGNRYVALMGNPGSLIRISEDLRTWQTIPPLPDVNASQKPMPWFDGTMAVIAGNNNEKLFFLNDSLQWERATLPSVAKSVSQTIWVEADQTLYLQINEFQFDASPKLIRSKDQQSWQTVAIHPDVNNLDDLIISDGVLVGFFQWLGRNRAMFSFDKGTSWTMAPINLVPRAVTRYGSGYLVATGRVHFTTNGSQFTSGQDSGVGFVHHNGELFTWSELFDVHKDGAAVYRVESQSSLTKLTCTDQLGPVTGFCRGDAGFLAIGYFGLAVSKDTIDWQIYEKPTDDMSGNVVFGNGVYVASLESTSSWNTRYAVSRDAIHWTIEEQSDSITHALYLPGAKKFVCIQSSMKLDVFSSDDASSWELVSPSIPDLQNVSVLRLVGDVLLVSYSELDHDRGIAYTRDLIHWTTVALDDLSSFTYANGLYGLSVDPSGSEILLPSGEWIVPDSHVARLRSAPRGLHAASYSNGKEVYHYTRDGRNWLPIVNPPHEDYSKEVHIDDDLYIFGNSVVHMRYDAAPNAQIEITDVGVSVTVHTAGNPLLALSKSHDLKNWTPLETPAPNRVRATRYLDLELDDDSKPVFIEISDH